MSDPRTELAAAGARLAALGLIEEHSAGAVRRLSRMFATDTAPYNPMIF